MAAAGVAGEGYQYNDNRSSAFAVTDGAAGRPGLVVDRAALSDVSNELLLMDVDDDGVATISRCRYYVMTMMEECHYYEDDDGGKPQGGRE